MFQIKYIRTKICTFFWNTTIYILSMSWGYYIWWQRICGCTWPSSLWTFYDMGL